MNLSSSGSRRKKQDFSTPLSAGKEEYQALLEGREKDPHKFLGMHTVKGGIAVRAYDPLAKEIFIHLENGARIRMSRLHEEGIFEWIFPRKRKHFFLPVGKSL